MSNEPAPARKRPGPAEYRGPVTVLSMRDATNDEPWHLYIAGEAHIVASTLAKERFRGLPQVTLAYDIDQGGSGGITGSAFLDAGVVYVNPDAVATIATYRA